MPLSSPARQATLARAVLTSATDFAIVTTGLDGRVTSWNPGAEQLLGWSADEMLGKSACRFFTPEDNAADRCDVEMTTARETGRCEDERWHLRKDGSRLWASGLMMRFEDEGTGEHIGYLKILRDRTPQHQANEVMRESERQYRSLAEALPGFVFATDAAGRKVYTNSFYQRFTGRDMAGLAGDRWLEVVHPDERSAVAEHWRRAVEGGEAYVRHTRFRQHDGAYRTFRCQALPERDDEGHVLRWAGTCVDVEDQRQAEARLAYEKGLLDAVVTQAPIGIAITPADQAARPTLNTSMRAILGHGIGGTGVDRYGGYGALHPDDTPYRPDDYPTMRALTEGEQVERELMRYRLGPDGSHPEGSLRRLEVTSGPVRDAGGRIVAAVTVAQDVEDRIRAGDDLARLTAELREFNARLETEVEARTAERDRMWETSPDLLLVIDFQGVFRRVNPAWGQILGYDVEDLVGHHVNEFVLPEDHDETVSAYESAAHGGLPRIENRYRHKDGSIRWISWTAAPAGDLTYATGRDVTGRKEQAEALAQAEEQLRQAQKMEAVGQLTGGLAHDFNNLLTGITGSLEMMSVRIAQGRMGDVEKYNVAAQGAARRAAALTHRLLAFSRRQTLDPKAVQPNRLVEDMMELIGRTVGPEVDARFIAGEDIWTTLVDPHQLENALLNLCINARDAMPGGGRLTIETNNRTLDARAAALHDLEPGRYVALCVSDSGTGMTPEVIAKAFDPFFTTKPIGVGTGLGLSMIYGFARQSGGHVRIYSEVGEGTTVCIYLPRHLGEAEGAEQAADLAGAPRAEDGETVLVVDDEPSVRMLVTDVLEELGYTAIEAADGPAGLKVLQSDARIDLLVSDVGLSGGMNGRQMADAARVGRPELKILFITGYAENAAVGNGHLEAGMHVMTKPFAMEALATRIRTLIEGA